MPIPLTITTRRRPPRTFSDQRGAHGPFIHSALSLSSDVLRCITSTVKSAGLLLELSRPEADGGYQFGNELVDSEIGIFD